MASTEQTPRRDWNNRRDVLQAFAEAQAAGDMESAERFRARFDELPPPRRSRDNPVDVRQAAVEARILGDTPASQELEAHLAELENVRAVDGMGELDGQLASMGSTFDNSWRGLRQLGSLAVEYNPQVMIADRVFGTNFGDRAQAYRGELEREQDERDAINDPLNSEYRTGQVLGYGSQVLGPGLGLKGASLLTARAAPAVAPSAASGALALDAGAAGAARMFLPETIRGAATQGAVLGAMQGTGTNDSRAANVVIGGATGGAGQALAPWVGYGVRGLLNAFRPVTQAGRERVVGGLLQRFATDPDRIAAPQPDAILGQAPTLAEATLDPGIAQLQRALVSASNETASAVSDARLSANLARTGLLEQFAGTEADRVAALAGIRQAEDAAYGAIRPLDGVDVAPVVAQIEQVLASGAGRRAAVAGPLREVLNSLRARQGGGLETSVDQLIGVRGNINDLIAGTPLTGASPAQAELIAVREALDAQIRQVAPRLDEALDARRLGMRPVEEMNLIQQLLRDGAGDVQLPDGRGAARLLNPASFVRMTDDFGPRSRFDAAARTATGFRRAEADNVLSDEAMDAVTGIRDGLLRQTQADRLAMVPGSPTAQYLATQNLLDGFRIPDEGAVPNMLTALIQRPVNWIYGVTNLEKRLQQTAAEAITNPARAAELLARLPPRDRVLVEQAIAPYLGGTANTTTLVGNPQR